MDYYIESKNKKYQIIGYSIIENNRIFLSFPDNPIKLSEGFLIKCGENLIFDASDYIYRWDVIDHRPNEIWYTNDPDYHQTKPFPVIENVPEQTEPLNNKELTECVADLMEEVSLLQMGLY